MEIQFKVSEAKIPRIRRESPAWTASTKVNPNQTIRVLRFVQNGNPVECLRAVDGDNGHAHRLWKRLDQLCYDKVCPLAGRDAREIGCVFQPPLFAITGDE